MDTSDEEVRKFFKHSSVKVLLCPRSSCRNGHSWVKKQVRYAISLFYVVVSLMCFETSEAAFFA